MSTFRPAQMAETQRQELFNAGANVHARAGLRDGPRGDGLRGPSLHDVTKDCEARSRRSSLRSLNLCSVAVTATAQSSCQR